MKMEVGRMKKLMVLFLASILLLAACSTQTPESKPSGDSKDNGSDGKEAEELTIWAWDPNFNVAALNIAIEGYKADQPDANFKIIENAQDDIVQKLNTGLSSGTQKGLPNIVLIEDYRAQSFYKRIQMHSMNCPMYLMKLTLLNISWHQQALMEKTMVSHLILA